jgi:hypothetical protein
MMTDQSRHNPRRHVEGDDRGDETIHDEHPTEPAEGARDPGEDAGSDVQEHPVEPAEGRTDIER